MCQLFFLSEDPHDEPFKKLTADLRAKLIFFLGRVDFFNWHMLSEIPPKLLKIDEHNPSVSTALKNYNNPSAFLGYWHKILIHKTKYKLSKRSIQYVDDFCYRIGSSQYPSQKCQVKGIGAAAGGTAAGTRITANDDGGVNVGEAYSHVLRLTGNLNTQTAHNLISQESFAQSELNNGTGLIAMDLSAFADGSVNSGLNTLNNMPVSLEINRTAAADAIIQTDTFSIHELVIIRDASGQLSSVY